MRHSKSPAASAAVLRWTEKTTSLAALACLLAGAAVPAPARADEPIRIGMVLAKQGAVAIHSEYLMQGANMALEEDGGKVLGRPVQLIWLDEPSPQAAQQNMQKLIDEDKVVAIVGGGTSANALALSALANRAKIPFIAPNAAADELTGKACNRYTFRAHLPVKPQVRAMSQQLLTLGKRWYFLTASYAFGQGVSEQFQKQLLASGGTVAGADAAPLNTPDYTSYILKIRQAKPDVVVSGLAGSDVSTFLKQWNEMGMKGQIPIAQIGSADSDIWGVGPNAVAGYYSKDWYFNNSANVAEDKTFAAAYQKKYKHPAPDRAWTGWFVMRSLLQSIDQAKSVEPAAIVKALEAWRDPNRPMPAYYRAWDHQMLVPILVAKVKSKIPDNYDFLDVVKTLPDNAAGLDALYGDKADVGCQMGAL
ncbi:MULTISPECIES: ABC transporter substrate-binding protein [Burkholderiaceae]|uniref:ABC transporter substrate-binding protein n=1 Tax=Burkholderiaceae TaxID=119060 RepID=UPI00141DCFA2|nr:MULTISPECIES: ABC transporter substrate-binding protein [Burkholderiaceae]NIF54148.1 ABC transporter substrate-binding protein [Burkholderia sp. Ax-1724]NIF77741.1 ABC transporter substrate-binding protein [Paraburkholderia sp. Cy-641]